MEEFEGADRRRGLWAKSFAEADGDEVKAKVFYLKARVLQLEQERSMDVKQIPVVEPEAATLEPAHRRSFHEEEQERMRILAQAQRERDSQPKGRCPNGSCNALVPISAQGCAACGALFDVGAAWRPIPLT